MGREICSGFIASDDLNGAAAEVMKYLDYKLSEIPEEYRHSARFACYDDFTIDIYHTVPEEKVSKVEQDRELFLKLKQTYGW